jgi:hypothetical protein
MRVFAGYELLNFHILKGEAIGIFPGQGDNIDFIELCLVNGISLKSAGDYDASQSPEWLICTEPALAPRCTSSRP